ncbi:glycerophosphodiester phosphodiesterase domain-containing protein 5-like [Styela clava]
MSNSIEYYCRIINSGIYGCKWKIPDNDNEETKIVEKVWWSVLLLILMLATMWLFCWSVFNNDYNDFEWFIYDNSGIWFGFGILILVVFSLVVFYLVILACSGIVMIARGKQKHLHLCHKICVVVSFLLILAGIILVQQLWNEEYYAAVIALKMTGPFLHIALLFVVTASSWLMFYEIMRFENRVIWLSSNIGVLVLFLLVFFIPLLITSPCIGPELGSIPKPLLIGHRLGKVTTAPENTILAYEKGAASCSNYAVETDISISMDGVPFLMHDWDSLKRTTNIEKVFANKPDQAPSLFTWNELQELDAGSWFLQQDPFNTVRFLSEGEKTEIRQQKIPSLDQIARMIGQNSIIFDLYRPYTGNPYRFNYTEVVMNVLLNSGLPQEQVLWLPSNNRENIHEQAPGFRLVSVFQSIDFLKENNIDIVNLGYLEHTPESISNFVRNNISVIQYVVNTPWLFSYTWCQGTTYVTTNECERLSNISNPIWRLSNGEYIAMWVCLDLFALIILVLIFMIQYTRARCSHFPWLTNLLCDRRYLEGTAATGIVNINQSFDD